MTNPENYTDLSSLFEEADKDFDSPDFSNAVTHSIKQDEARRRFVLSGFGLCGGLIAGSQLPFLFDILIGFELNFDVSKSTSLLGLDVSSLILWLLVGMIGLATIALSTGETT